MKLSVLITSHNEDWGEVQNTLHSVRETAGNNVEIVVVDDATQVPLSLQDKNAILVRNNYRAGVGASRDIAAQHASGDFYLVTDAHMRFQDGWLDFALDRIVDRPSTIYNASCVALSVNQMDMDKAQTVYTGARLSLYGPERGNMEVLEGKWLPARPDDDFPISCIMGATYFISADWYAHIHGLKLLKGWGSDEPLLAIKTWLAGGECRAMKTVRIGHQFRQASPYRTPNWALLWNKMMLAYTCFPEAKADKIISLLQGSNELLEAKNRFNDDMGLILAERAYLQSIFVRSLDWYLEYFGIKFPE